MKFKHKVIGRNTPENREFVKLLGYNTMELQDIGSCLYTKNDNCYNMNPILAGVIDKSGEYMNCAKNDKLFRAIVALRFDSDYMQWFVDPCGYWHFNPGLMDGMRKATITELCNRFKLI